jgi:hypothetical protein
MAKSKVQEELPLEEQLGDSMEPIVEHPYEFKIGDVVMFCPTNGVAVEATIVGKAENSSKWLCSIYGGGEGTPINPCYLRKK